MIVATPEKEPAKPAEQTVPTDKPAPAAEKANPPAPPPPEKPRAEIAATTRAKLEAARSKMRQETNSANSNFINYVDGKLATAVATNQPEQLKQALSEIRKSPDVGTLSEDLRSQLDALQRELEGTLEYPTRKVGEAVSSGWNWLPNWAKVGLVGTGGVLAAVEGKDLVIKGATKIGQGLKWLLWTNPLFKWLRKNAVAIGLAIGGGYALKHFTEDKKEPPKA